MPRSRPSLPRIEVDRPMLLLGAEMDDAVEVRLGKGRCCAISRRCPGKTTVNEDSAALVTLGRGRSVLIVADGLGGAPDGDQASQTAVQEIVRALSERATAHRSLRESLLSGIEAAKERISGLREGAATTLAAVEIDGAAARIYHVGDSEVFLTSNRGELRWRTTPHSPVGYAVEAGLLDVDDAVHSDHRHLVSNVVGEGSMSIELSTTLPLRKHDTLLLCSDGLVDNLFEDEIVELVHKGPPKKALQRLFDAASHRMLEPVPEQPSKADDLTILLYRH